MFMVVYAYHVRPGNEETSIAICQDWQRNQPFQSQGCTSRELLFNVDDPEEFIAMASFDSG